MEGFIVLSLYLEEMRPALVFNQDLRGSGLLMPRSDLNAASDLPKFEMSPILVLVLGLLTCGLFLIYWNLKVSEVLNAVTGRNAISPAIAVLSGFCCPVNGYFYYLAGGALGEVGKRINKEEELKGKATMLFVLGLFLPMVAAMIVQGHLNELYEG